MTSNLIIVKSGFLITGIGAIVFLQHQQNGLAKDTLITSVLSKRQWLVTSRILQEAALDIHRVFQNESVDYMHAGYSSEEKLSEMRLKVVQEEEQSVFQYLIKPLNHTEKPIEGEELRIN